MHCCAKRKRFQYQYSGKCSIININQHECSMGHKSGVHLYSAEPVGSKAPTFSTDYLLSSIKRHSGQGFALLCQAQAFPVPIFRQVLFHFGFQFVIEPVGAKSPTFSSESIQIVRRNVGHGFALLCQAQSYPAPVFRQVLLYSCFYFLCRAGGIKSTYIFY